MFTRINPRKYGNGKWDETYPEFYLYGKTRQIRKAVKDEIEKPLPPPSIPVVIKRRSSDAV
jgi:hypothetical protein